MPLAILANEAIYIHEPERWAAEAMRFIFTHLNTLAALSGRY